MNDDYDNAKADKAILEKLTMDQDGECDYPECDDVPERESGFCAFHTLLRRQALGEDIPERALEIAFENPNDITSDAALKKARTEPKKARPQIVPGGGFQMSDEANYRAEGTAECGCTFRQNRKDYETEVEYCKLHGAAPRMLLVLRDIRDFAAETPELLAPDLNLSDEAIHLLEAVRTARALISEAEK